MASTKSLYPNLNFFAPCRKKGHDNQPLNLVLTLPNVKQRLICSNCLIFEYSDMNKNAVGLKEFLDNYRIATDEVNRFVDDNLDFVKLFEKSVDVTATFTEEENLTAVEFIKRSEVNKIEERFGDLLRAEKILIENAAEKLKNYIKKHFDDVERGISALNEYDEKRKNGKLRELLSSSKAGDDKSLTKLCDYMALNPIRTDLTILDVKSKLQNYPTINSQKFEYAKEEILEYTLEKLKDLLEWHVRFPSNYYLITMYRVSRTLNSHGIQDQPRSIRP